jgi:hypothetical protein
MTSPEIAGITFACIFGGALLGMFCGTVLPEHHLSADSKDVVKVGMGLIATMAALVLGLLTGSAKSSFDTQDAELKQMAANVILLDRTLAHYGPETKNIRDQIKRAITYKLPMTWPEDGSAARTDLSETTPAVEGIEDAIRALLPQNEIQRALRSRALHISDSLLQTRWLMFGQQAGNAIQTPVARRAGVLARCPVRELRPVRAPQCHRDRGPGRFRAVGLGRDPAHPRDEPALPGAGEGLQRTTPLHPGASWPVAATGRVNTSLQAYTNAMRRSSRQTGGRFDLPIEEIAALRAPALSSGA